MPDVEVPAAEETGPLTTLSGEESVMPPEEAGETPVEPDTADGEGSSDDAGEDDVANG